MFTLQEDNCGPASSPSVAAYFENEDMPESGPKSYRECLEPDEVAYTNTTTPY